MTWEGREGHGKGDGARENRGMEREGNMGRERDAWEGGERGIGREGHEKGDRGMGTEKGRKVEAWEG